MNFVDIHIHALSGVDDGARSENEMYQMIDKAYRSGTRTICFTPHCAPEYFGFNGESISKSFQKAAGYVHSHHPDMQVYLGNELQYAREFPSWIRCGECRTLNDTRYLLVDFPLNEEKEAIVRGMYSVLNTGYCPILAHVERYSRLNKDLKCIFDMKRDGIVLQMDSQSLLGGFGILIKLAARRILKEGFVDVISSDAHRVEGRTPDLSEAYKYVVSKYGESQAEMLFASNAHRILKGKDIREEI